MTGDLLTVLYEFFI